ncbi:zinc finger protein castor homolog 1 isoform X2 [Electrophorus electricus]|uniref:zinc finger protein castor homolog 1 isoform X2 n=1 Tax=Electrophorus electricus TaxID=8005 RepID=UPI0015CFE398|nr:zinc finger protein castor homolog 1 isoform X2 [Electrophorus electricus]
MPQKYSYAWSFFFTVTFILHSQFFSIHSLIVCTERLLCVIVSGAKWSLCMSCHFVAVGFLTFPGNAAEHLHATTAERGLCTEKTSGNSTMAAKRKGGLKLNAICAKLSRQVVYDGSSQTAELDASVADHSERGSSHYEEPDGDFAEALSLGPGLEDEQKRREAIEKWVNGEYADDPPSVDTDDTRGPKGSSSDEGPPEGVYMVQPKGCSDEEDNGHEVEAMPASHDGSFHDDRDSEDSAHKETGYPPSSETTNCQASFSSPGEASALRDYAASTMNEFLHMFGYDDQQVRDELAKKISFDKMKSATSDPSSMSSEEATRRARFSKYEEYIRKLKAGEALAWPAHAKSDELGAKAPQEKSSAVLQASSCLPGADAPVFPVSAAADHKQAQLAVAPGNASHSLASRTSKYDFFIQKLKMGESLRQQNGGAYKRPSKYDLENVKYLHLFKPGEGNPDMGGAIAFKTGKVGRPSKYDVQNNQKLTPGKGNSPIMPGVLSSSSSGAPATPGLPSTASAGPVGPSCLPGEQVGHLGFNSDYMKSSFSKTDSITTGTVSSVKNGLPPEKPVTEDVNVYQKYIARFSGSQHCGHMHCAYQYREHYHCMDPECNYQRFTSKQDVIRHYNMHKKRDNSLQHGFMRFSPLDDCSVYYHGCHLNGKSTHYHCMQVGCNKVYTSTSDVMTHENFHKKNAQLINDGFQRFRATEDCGTVSCQFYGQKTTHFHCRRPGCTFTFKNKCDIEKHKSYHIKDDAYAKDGFKKFYKYEECKYEGCVYSKATNHFHCIRQGCGFTFTSTSQMTSHKRKHERRHVRSSSGVLGLASSFLLPKEEQEESSNDDLVDFSAISSRNSSLSASPTTQQPPTTPHLLTTPATAVTSGQSVKPTPALPPAARMSTLLSQALPGSMPMALALSSSALGGASNPFFPLLPRLPLQLPAAAAGLVSAAGSAAHSATRDSLAPSAGSAGETAPATAPSTPAAYAASSIMEKISASKGLISPMMARLAAAALNPGSLPDTGNGQHTQAGRFNPVQVKQEPMDTTSGTLQESMQEHSLDLSKKDHSNESNGHPAPGNSSLLSSLMNKMTQVNPGFFGALSLKSEMPGGQAPDSTETAHYLSRLMKRPVQEKTPELWKSYLRRYDTDEVCDAQCDFLNKVHFHCVVEDCGALFSTVDGAVKHANFHFRANLKVKSETSFGEGKDSNEGGPDRLAAPGSTVATTPPVEVPGAAMSGGYGSSPSLLAWKQLAGSIPHLPASMPNIAATSPLATTSLENAKPQVKPGFLQFQENDPCLATDCKYSNKFHFHCLFGNCKYVCKTSGKAESHCLDHINPNNSLVNVRDQFSYYSLQCLCPNQHCEFRMRGHYHCLRPGCFFVTNITTKLPWHIKKHEKAERRAANGFKYFTKREECGRLGCKYNQVNSHFHCIREGCLFSFLLKHQMTSHARKHMRRMLGKNFDRVPSQVVPHGHQADDMQHMTSLASTGAMTGHPGLGPGYPGMMDDADDYMDYMGVGSPLGLSSESSNQDRSCTSTPVGNDSSPAGMGCHIPTPAAPTSADTPPTSQSAPPPPPPPPAPPAPQAPLQSQPPSFPPALLRPPLPSLPYLLSPSCVSYSLLSASLGATRSVVMPTNTPAFGSIIATPSPVKNDVPIVQDAAGNTISIPAATGAKKRFWIIEDMSPFGKRRKTASSRKMLDEGMMLDGFRRYDLYEDCKDAACQFSLKVTHYHCTRENCGYKFCGRTHMYKHAQHHDRVDNLVLDDFKRFKSSLSCNFADCQFSGNSTHFHCLRCGFRCTDSTKVTAHRKHHGKQDVISAAGFCQFSSSADCEVVDCKYKLKCSHFHCTYPECKHTVVGMSQMDSHKRKHEKQERGEPAAISPGRDGGTGGHGHHQHHQTGLAPPPTSVSLRSTSPGAQGLGHSTTATYLPPGTGPGEYPDLPRSGISLDGSLNLGTDAGSSLFFLKGAAGLGLANSLDLSKKLQREPLSASPASMAVAAAGLANLQDDTTGTSGDPEDDLSPEDEPAHEEEDEDEDEDEPEEDLNTDSYDDSTAEPDGEKDNGEHFHASMNHTETSRLEKEEADL